MKDFKFVSTIFFFIFTTIVNAQVEGALPAEDATGVSLEDIRSEIANFKKELETTKTRTLPLADKTNFDSFIDEGDYNAVDIKALDLEKIYAGITSGGFNYRPIASYKINFSDAFYSVVVTVKNGAANMESTLINYNLDGEIVAHILVAHDEITETPTSTTSKITQDRITRNHRFGTGQDKRVETSEYRITASGKIEELSAEVGLIENVIKQLGLTDAKLNSNLITTKVNPANTEETIMVIPQYGSLYENEVVFNLNSYIVIVNNRTGSITHNYFESAKTNGWVSDAEYLSEITIDTAPYLVTNGKRAFGIRLNHVAVSQTNELSKVSLSVFIKSENTLRKVLDNYEVFRFHDQWDSNCFGELMEVNKTLIMSENDTNGFFNIKVKKEVVQTVSFKNEEQECDTKEKKSQHTDYLIFDGETYQNN